MKNLLKIAVVALALSCFQAYGHHHWYRNYYTNELRCRFPCSEAEAICKVKDFYAVKEIVEVIRYRTHFLVFYIDIHDHKEKIAEVNLVVREKVFNL